MGRLLRGRQACGRLRARRRWRLHLLLSWRRLHLALLRRRRLHLTFRRWRRYLTLLRRQTRGWRLRARRRWRLHLSLGRRRLHLVLSLPRWRALRLLLWRLVWRTTTDVFIPVLLALPRCLRDHKSRIPCRAGHRSS